MNLDTWQASNGAYLSASLTWLRLRLKQLAQQNSPRDASREAPAAATPPATPTAPSTPAQPAQRSVFDRLPGRKQPPAPAIETASATPAAEVKLLPDASESLLEEQLAQQVAEATAAREQVAQVQPPPALLLLAEQLQLTSFERDVVLLCTGMEFDTRIPALCAQALGNPEQSYPTFALALSLFDSPSWDALSAQSPLRYWRLIDVSRSETQPLITAPLRADERIVNYIKGLNTLDERLTLLVRHVPADAMTLPPSQQASADAILWRWENAPASEHAPVAVLLGSDANAKMLVAQHVAAMLRRQLYRAGLDGLPNQPAEVEALARLWQRESLLLPLALFVDAQVESTAPEAFGALDRFVARAARSNSAMLLGSREPLARMSFSAFTLDVNRPTTAEQRDAWQTTMSALDEAQRHRAANWLAGQFSMNTPDIRRLAESTQAEPAEALPQRLWDASRDRARPRLDTLAQRIEPRATWDDLVLSEDTLRLLRELVAQVEHRSTVYEDWGFARKMNRGLGISALFSGESGTGKTMAAEVIANALRLALYRIDLSQVVSKYIGETEKNLQRVFDLMEGGGAILFFDEADALFGKRSEVRDSHDRYANIEINYLLQRMETYTGLAILATNMKNALDLAFMRRLRFIVTFNFPGPAERRQMWEKAFPPGVPLDALDTERLARLNLTGANIHNIALNAAFLAAKAESSVTTPLVLLAARNEFRKLERPINEADFRL